MPPYSAQEVVGRQVELRCHAPRGKPEPHLSWLKDGRQVAEDEDGIIVTTEGHLIIVSARTKDSGNFTCVADNLAGSRRSPPAEIVIYGEFLTLQVSLTPPHSCLSRVCGRLVVLELLVEVPGVLRPEPRPPGAPPEPRLPGRPAQLLHGPGQPEEAV